MIDGDIATLNNKAVTSYSLYLNTIIYLTSG